MTHMLNDHKATLKKEHHSKRERARERESKLNKNSVIKTHILDSVFNQYTLKFSRHPTFFFHKPYCGAFTTLQLMTTTDHILIYCNAATKDKLICEFISHTFYNKCVKKSLSSMSVESDRS